jgi:hypothetical protein
MHGGGPATPGSDPQMQEIPTTTSIYIIDSVGPYTTSSWPASKLKWGTELKDMKKDVWYKLKSGKWGSIKNDIGMTRNEVRDYNKALYGRYVVPKTWLFNDFGPLAIRYFRDINNNRKLDKAIGERLSGEMIHTTPENEAQYQTGKTVQLGPSHGCVHIKPQDRQVLQGMDAFNSGTTFVVHGYSERI